MIYVDKLNFFSLIQIINSGEKKFYVLSEYNRFYSRLIQFMNLFNYEFFSKSFFYGDLFSSSGESMYIKTRRSASEMSFNYSQSIINKLINKNEKELKISKSAIQSFISKRVFIEFEYFLRRIDYLGFQNSNNQSPTLIIERPKFIETEYLQNNTEINLVFCGSNHLSLLKQKLKLFLIQGYSIITYFFLNHKESNYRNNLCIASDPIGINNYTRHFPHWVDKEKFKNYVIINDKNQDVNISKKLLETNNIRILGKSSLMYLPINKNKLGTLNYSGIKGHLRIQIKKLKLLSNGMIILLRKYRCDKFIFTEPQDYISDAVILCKQNHKIKTFCIQYANTGFRTPLMISPVDYYLSFSKRYENVLKWKNISPKNFISCGYSFISKAKNKNMLLLKDRLNKLGVKKIISFFDESIEYHKWGLISYKAIKSEYEDLANFVIKNKDFAVITKPQFIFNSIEKFNSKVIEKAINTQRFIEVKQGKHRNIITPQHVGSISDISISNLIGGTAGIEAALAGSAIFFINPYKYKPHFYDLLIKRGLVFNTINEILEKDLDNYKYKNASEMLTSDLISNNHKVIDIIE